MSHQTLLLTDRPILHFMDHVVHLRHDGFFVHYILWLFIFTFSMQFYAFFNSALIFVLRLFHLRSSNISLLGVCGQFLAWRLSGWFNKILIFSMGCNVTSCTYILRSPTSYSMDFVEHFWHDNLFWSAWKFSRLSFRLSCHDYSLPHRPIRSPTVRRFL